MSEFNPSSLCLNPLYICILSQFPQHNILWGHINWTVNQLKFTHSHKTVQQKCFSHPYKPLNKDHFRDDSCLTSQVFSNISFHSLGVMELIHIWYLMNCMQNRTDTCNEQDWPVWSVLKKTGPENGSFNLLKWCFNVLWSETECSSQ